MATTARSRAAKKAAPARPMGKPFCSTPPRPQPPLPAAAAADPRRARAILNARSKWLNGTVLHYCFFTGESHFAVPKTQADAIRQAFAAWKAAGHRPRVRGSAAAQRGRGPHRLLRGRRQFGFGGRPRRAAGSAERADHGLRVGPETPYGRGTALHELGHVLGMEHEHQNPFAGITWHEQAVYDSLGKPPNNWTARHDVPEHPRKLSPTDVQGSTGIPTRSWNTSSSPA